MQIDSIVDISVLQKMVQKMIITNAWWPVFEGLKYQQDIDVLGGSDQKILDNLLEN